MAKPVYDYGFPFDHSDCFVEVRVYRKHKDMLTAARRQEQKKLAHKQDHPANEMGCHIPRPAKWIRKKGVKNAPWELVTKRTGIIFFNLESLRGKHGVITVLHEFLHAASWYARNRYCSRKRNNLLEEMEMEEKFADCVGWPMQCFYKEMVKKGLLKKPVNVEDKK
jgi:hypothetical protein